MFKTDYQQYIYKSRYARWNEKEGRREEWNETVARYCDFMSRIHKSFPYTDVYNAIYNLEVMPSMRALMTAGPALERDNMAGYNCSYVTMDHPRSFDEIMYILMCGTGNGFSVERKYVKELPVISEEFHETSTCIRVSDSRVGWAAGFRELISLLYSGRLPKWDLSLVRPGGTKLKTFGGRSAGSEPLNRLFEYTTNLFQKARGRKLTSLECHDLVCNIADVVISGGVRRSALLSLSDLDDNQMRSAKTGQWYLDHPYRAMANNSAVYLEKPDLTTFMKEWLSLYESKSGERGIFNRMAATERAKSTGRRDYDEWEFGTNPCGEVILRPMGLCNLTEVVIRPSDDYNSLKRKVELATILGTFQSTFTDFRYVRSIWKKNAEEERLLGVSLTGIWDNGRTNNVDSNLHEPLTSLLRQVVEINTTWARRLKISPSVATTCIKPSGTVSQLVNCSSGIHPPFAPYYIRNVRNDTSDPLYKFLLDQGVPNESDHHSPDSVGILTFPISTTTSSDLVPEQMVEKQQALFETYSKHWTEHNISNTLYYQDETFLSIGNWIYNNFDNICGITCLPKSNHIYKQAPFIEISKEEYKKRVNEFPKINWDKLKDYEKEDTGIGGYTEPSCSAGMCEI